jgi:hypothetical protein
VGADLVDDITGRFTKEHLKNPEGKTMVAFGYVKSKDPDGTYEVDYFRFDKDFKRVPHEPPPPEYETYSWGSYKSFEDLRIHQLSLWEYAAKRVLKGKLNLEDGRILNFNIA